MQYPERFHIYTSLIILVKCTIFIINSLINLFSWSGLIDTDILLKDAFQVPNLKTGKMEPLMSALTEREEEQFSNMLKRINTIFQVIQRNFFE